MVNFLLIASLCVVWGATWVVIKIGLSESPPFYAATFRFVLAVGILASIAAYRRSAWPRSRSVWMWTAISGVLMYFGSYSVVYFVEQYINAALAAILFASFPFFVAVGAHFYLLHERLTALKIVGLVVGFAGVVALFSGGATAPSTKAWWAPGLMLLSPLCAAISSVIVKKHLTKEDPYVLNVIQMGLGILLLFPLAFVIEDLSSFKWNATSIGAVVFLGSFGSAFAFVTLYSLMKKMAASRLSLIAFVTPVVAALLGWWALDETPTWATVAGAALVLLGIYIVNILAERDKTIAIEAAAVEAIDCRET